MSLNPQYIPASFLVQDINHQFELYKKEVMLKKQKDYDEISSNVFT